MIVKWLIIGMTVMVFTIGCSNEEEGAPAETLAAAEEGEANESGPEQPGLKAIGCNAGGDFQVVCPAWSKMISDGWTPVGYSTTIPGPGSYHHFVLFQK